MKKYCLFLLIFTVASCVSRTNKDGNLVKAERIQIPINLISSNTKEYDRQSCQIDIFKIGSDTIVVAQAGLTGLAITKLNN